MTEIKKDNQTESLDIAIVGMEGRFPGARNLDEFWRNLRDGVESICPLTEEQMRSLGVSPAALSSSNFVKAAALLEGSELFDAPFFGYSPREAEVMDPQHRVFLECAWSALENAGYNPETYPGLIGVYAGTSMSTYLLYNILARAVDPEDSFQVMIGNDKDFLSTRVSYELNLKGPSIDVQSACSTSLVAVHLACQGLLSYQCDMAMAGGISIQVPQRAGYFYQEGGISSPDGHCRAFDAKAEGTVFGSGVGIVVLKRLSDALLDRDTIHAVIKGSAINNDGSLKVGYTAPSVEGQAQVIMMAQLISDVTPETVTYVEAHGTGTPLGDPVEIAALTKAFRASTLKTRFCAIGSVKSNIGHLDAAAGVAGLIKTVLALKHKLIPASLHFDSPNPAIDFDNSPFFVNDRLKAWESDEMVRRAGVSSFGVGGTNAHVIVEEWQQEGKEAAEKEERWEVVVMSGRSPEALEEATREMGEYLSSDEAGEIGDISYTTREGRKGFERRRAVISRGVEEAALALVGNDAQKVVSGQKGYDNRTLVFMFPGGGTQYVGMGRGIYESERTFREQVDLCAEILEPRLGYDLRNFLYPRHERTETVSELLKQTSIALPALFVVEYALAKLWMSWCATPEAMIGHSVGEYVAACLAEVFSLEDALALVVLRGELLERLPAGAMCSVPLSEAEARLLIDERFSIAAINGPSQCVISGPAGAMDELTSVLGSRGIEFRMLQIKTASHSPMVQPILEEFTSSIAKLRLQAPKIPYLSNVTGTWVTEEVTDPLYWARHLRQTVRFADGIKELLASPERVLLEVGPGHASSTLTRLQPTIGHSPSIITSMRHPYDRQEDMAFLLRALGKMWVEGVEVDWREYDKLHHRRRVPLPTYPFQRSRFWLDPMPTNSHRPAPPSAKINDISRWFYAPSWSRCQPPSPSSPPRARSWLIFDDQLGLGSLLAQRRREEGELAWVVKPGPSFNRLADDEYEIDITSPHDYRRLLDELKGGGAELTDIAHLLGVRRLSGQGRQRVEEAIERCYTSLLLLGQAVMGRGRGEAVRMAVITSRMQEVESWEESEYEKSVAKGVVKVMGQEAEWVRCQSIDFVMRGEAGESERVVRQIEEEMSGSDVEAEVAYRGRLRWVRRYERVEMKCGEGGLKQGGVYLITGGLGRVGLMLADYLAKEIKARIVLVGRSRFPPKDNWQEWIEQKGEQDPVSLKIRRLTEAEQLGAVVDVKRADVCDEEEMKRIIEQVYEQYGRLNGVIHAAGAAGERVFCLIQDQSKEESESQLRAKVYGAYVLQKVLEGKELDFRMLFSSNASILGGIGLISYSAANIFMDALATSRNWSVDERWISVNWDGWLVEEDLLSKTLRTSMDQYAMTPAESLEAFARVASQFEHSQVVVSTGDLFERLDLWVKNLGLERSGASQQDQTKAVHLRPALNTDYAPPTDEIQMTIARVWQEQLGIDRLGIHDNFFELGGNSLIGLKVVSLLKKELGVDIPIVALFEGPTVSALAEIIARNGNQSPSYEESRNRGERRRAKRTRKNPESQAPSSLEVCADIPRLDRDK